MRTGSRTVLAAALLCFAACGKKEDVAPTPILPVPGSSEKATAQAEVKASSGPIELTLLLHKTHLKAGESIWQQIRIRNVGEKALLIADPIFADLRELRKQSRSGYGIYVEARGPDGKPLDVEFNIPAAEGSDIGHGVSGLLEIEGPEEQALFDGWKKQGLNPREINNRLYEHNSKKRLRAEIDRIAPPPELLPGKSVETKSAFFYSMQDKIHGRPRPSPIGDFSQLDFFILKKPGNYMIRAVYDFEPTEKSSKLSRRLGLPTFVEEVTFRTPWIRIEVRP